MRKMILLIIVAAVIAAGWFLYFNNGEPNTNVSVCEAVYMNVENSLEFSGEVAPLKMYSVMSETGGTIKKLYVSEGSYVNSGDPLFDFDKEQTQTLLEEARLNYDILVESAAKTVMAQSGVSQDMANSMKAEKAKVALALSQTTGYDYQSFNESFGSYIDENASAMAAALEDTRMQDVYDTRDSMSLEDAVLGTDNEIALAKISVQKLEAALEKMSYKSLLEGTVVALNINRGEVLSPGVPAMVIADTKNTIITAYVYEKDVNGLSEGMKVKIIADGLYYSGSVTKIGKAASGVGNASAFETMTKVEITPEEPFDKMPGAVVDLEIILSGKSNVLAIPLDCLVDDNTVFVVGENNMLEKREVATGFADTFNVEILGGLIEGETVVLSPKELEEGQKVVYD